MVFELRHGPRLRISQDFANSEGKFWQKRAGTARAAPEGTGGPRVASVARNTAKAHKLAGSRCVRTRKRLAT